MTTLYLEDNFAAKSLQLCPTLCDPIAHQAPLSLGFSKREHGVGCHFLLQEDNLGPFYKLSGTVHFLQALFIAQCLFHRDAQCVSLD